MGIRVLVVVATMGKSPVLEASLAAAAAQQHSSSELEPELLVVAQGRLSDSAMATINTYADRVLCFERPIGFAAANNAGLAEAVVSPGAGAPSSNTPNYIALINDDAIVCSDWLTHLVATLEETPTAAAVQGVNLLAVERENGSPDRPKKIDGLGIHWQRQQAVQIDHGKAWKEPETLLAASDSSTREVFGVSATAAVFRASALQKVASDSSGSKVFDEGLDTYYEDVDLACRLRTAGWTALMVPTAKCQHFASSSAPRDRRVLLVRNRHLVLARHLGRGYLVRLPLLLARDFLDFGFGALGGWLSVLASIGGYAHLAAPRSLGLPAESAP